MATRNLAASARGPLTLSLRAGMADVTVTASRDVPLALALITGPEDVVDGVTERMRGGEWEITLPGTDSGATVISSYGGGRTVIRGRVNSGVIIGGDNYGSTVIQAGGRVVVNGVDVSDVVNARGGDNTPLRVAVLLPAGSSLETEASSGDLRASGPLDRVIASSSSGDVHVAESRSLRAKTASGDIDADRTGTADVRSMSGSAVISAASGDVDADTMSGSIVVHCTAAVRVSARSMSGSVRVTADRGVMPRVSARSMSGRVSTPEGR